MCNMTAIVILLIINIFRDKDAHTSVATMGIQDVILVTFGTKVFTQEPINIQSP